ncbi:MAG: polysaccharide biosynthesis tyrosine autokinase [Frankiaceae bacterium]|nr:polysaccharide biosynthesis tyrosine autokinase [Arenimonas sp.]
MNYSIGTASDSRSPAMDLRQEADEEPILHEYWKILRSHRWVVIGVLVVVVAIALVLTALTTPIYRGQSTLQIQPDTIKVVNAEGLTSADSAFDRDFYQTQYELLQSRALALRVVQDTRLIEHPVFNNGKAATAKSSPGQVLSRQRAAVDAVLGSLNIEPVRNSQLVRISFDSSDRQLAARVANAYADAFITSNIEGRFNASAYAKKYLEERLAELQDKLQDSERQLVSFAEKEQIISLGDAAPSLSAQNLSELNGMLAKAQAERIKAEAEWRQADAGSGLGMPQVVDNTLIQGLRQARALLSSQYQDKLRLYKPAYPEMLQLQGQIAESDRQITAEVANIRSAVDSRYRSARQQESMLSQRIDLLKGDVLDLANRSIRYNILKREIATNQQLYDALLQRYKEIGVAGGIGANNISVVDRAEVPGRPFTPSWRRNLTLGFGSGLALGMLIALALHHGDRRIRSVKVLETLTRLPGLGVVPLLDAGVTPLVARADLRSPFSEAYRSVRTALQFSTTHGLPRSLLITSAGPGEGKTTTALELARNIAQLGRKVVLVDADLRKPSLHQLFGKPNAAGVSSVLAGASDLAGVCQKTEEPNLTLITSGPLPPNPPELLGSDRLVAMLEELSQSFDIVVLDGPPILGLADAPLLAGRAEAVLFVVNANSTRKDAVQSALHRLAGTHGHVLGTVLIRFDMKNSGEYGYHGYEYFSYGGKRQPT